MYNQMVNFNDPNELPKEMEFYTYEEFNKFISVEEDIKLICVFEILYYCGLRRGELRGLIWKNINFEKKTLSVVQNVVNANGDFGYWRITTPKTRTSTRTIPISEKLYKDLLKYKTECDKYYGFNEKWFVFGDVSPLHPDVLRRRKNTNATKAGVKQIRIHDFRHSCVSLLINNGANITIVSKYLGHAKIDETLNTYSHIFQNKLDDVVNTINNLNER
ncbi:MAG: site-specific integrase [Bacilli bacterium]